MEICLNCGKVIEPPEKAFKVYTCCARFYLCEKCAEGNEEYWNERMEFSKRNQEESEK